MTEKSYAKELETALKAVSEAAVLCEAVGAEARSASIEKNDKSPVTIADFGSQALVMKTLYEAFPGASVVSEEEAGILEQPENASLLARLVEHVCRVRPYTDASDVLSWINYGKADQDPNYFWTLDPIDGTKGFLRGDQYAVSLSLVVEGKLTVGALACPRLSASGTEPGSGIIMGAVAGRGAFQLIGGLKGDRMPIHVSKVSKNADIRFTESVESAHSSHSDSARMAEYLGITAAPCRIDSQAKYAAVARGDGDAYLRIPRNAVYREKIWDHGGGAIVVTEAGGKITDIKGRPLDFSKGSTLANNLGVIVTNGLVHDAVLDAVKALGIGQFE